MPRTGRTAWRALLLIGWVAAAAAADSAGPAPERMNDALRRSFTNATPEEWKTRLNQDRTQALCSQYRNAPPPEIATAIVAEARSGIRYPDGGRLLGDWRKGEQIALISGGGQISRLAPDPLGPKRGGNCYACHVLSSREVAAGNLGPGLTGYAKIRGTSEDSVRYTYEKIFNAQVYLACSFMPRFGHNGWLTPDQVADLVAFLLDPQSPVNR
jgi:L-cysteine S-thiosulfotransferase